MSAVTYTSSSQSANWFAAISPAGSGWYRCSITAYANVSGSSLAGFDIRPAITNSDGGNYTGDGTSGLYIWGVQLVSGLQPGSYVKTVATALPANYLAPSNVYTAQKLIQGTINSDSPFSGRIASSGVASTTLTNTMSIYAKQGDMTKFGMRMDDGASTNTVTAGFDLVAGTVDTAAASTGGVSSPSATITSVGNGWYRCTITGTWASMALPRGHFRVRDASGSFIFTGDGTSGMYFWGAQLEIGSIINPYRKTTSAVAGYDTTAIETNLLIRSEEFSNTNVWGTSNLLPPVADAAPNPYGYANTADLITETTDATVAYHTMQQLVTLPANNHTFTSLVFSCYAKSAGRDIMLKLQSANNTAASAEAGFNLTAGNTWYTAYNTTTAVSNVVSSITNIGGGWYRCSISCRLNVPSENAVLVTLFPTQRLYRPIPRKRYIRCLSLGRTVNLWNNTP